MRKVILIAGLAMAMVPGHGWMPARGLEFAPTLRTRDESQVLTDFQLRVRRYVAPHQQLEATGPRIPISDNWAEITAAVDALGGGIRAARTSARRGDVFSPEIERWFRQALTTCLEGVNTEAFLSMPPHLLAVLPSLPDELQYRFMSHDLILWDVHANIIVDFIT